MLEDHLNQVGFVVIDAEDKTVGICPIPQSHAVAAAQRYQLKHPGHLFRVAPVFFGIPLAVEAAPPIANNPQETA